MNEDIKKIGDLFKTKRNEMNLSLKEIENSTSIRSSYLSSIEDGRIDQFLTPVYTSGFIRQYASFLGMDVDRMIKEYPQAFKLRGEKHEFEYGIGTLEVRGSLGGGVKWFPNLIWAGLSAIVLVTAWCFAKYLGVI